MSTNMKTERKSGGVLYLLLIFGILACSGVLAYVLPKREYSKNENRMLRQFPKLTAKGVLSGEFQKQSETALSDQFPKRDIWVEMSTAAKRAAGFQDISGVYLGSDGYYLTKTTQEDIDQTQYLQNLRYVEYLGKKCNGKVNTLLVPSPGTILWEKLPKNAPYYNASAMYRLAGSILKNAGHIDARPALREYTGHGQVYYRTDHHWTLLGAYAAYTAYCEACQLDKRTFDYFAAEKVTEDFLGTMYSKVMPYTTKADTIYAAGKIPQAFITCDEAKKVTVYDKKKLRQKDKYAYFFGGNYSEVTLQMRENPKKKLLVVKDSYANCFVPFLMEKFGQITMLDLRYYRKSVQQLLADNQYTHVLVLYEMSNFAQDKNLYKLTQ